ncbi:translocation/assembly module TamB domain-containing protein [Leptothrix discophora]|uniref:Translocation/assembly module TamB domain-containing protein n=1 Tax=Leptothrix discophora TaxID=89 RepID=A0ABT9G6F6_LEPDI|nr:translocation/assembly module TamB domain-containing protein [Leptothrix discophora]MDP4302065.1 translocation/assembly module TamB domain-containing protein [Leptothrix discophora]
MSTEDTRPEPQTPDAAPPPRTRPRLDRLLWGHGQQLVGAMVAVVVAVSALVASLPFHAIGTRWLLTWVAPVLGLEAEAPQGALMDPDFALGRLVIELQPGLTLDLEQPRWQNLRWHWQPHDDRVPAHLALQADRVSAVRATLRDSRPPSPDPMTLPQGLVLPFALDVERVELAELALPDHLATPLTALSGRLRLAAGRQGVHQADALQARWDRLRLEAGSLALQADLPMTLSAHATLQPADAAASNGPTAPTAAPTTATTATTTAPPATAAAVRDWELQASADGPLADFRVVAQLRAARQSLDASARIQPTQAMPLTQLRAELAALDLGALASALPRTALTGRVDLQLDANPAGRASEPLHLQARLDNAQAGAWSDRRLPVHRLLLDARSDLREVGQGRVSALQLSLGSPAVPAGTLSATGQWALIGQGRERRVDIDLNAELANLQPQRLVPASPALQVGGPLALQLALPWPDGGAATRGFQAQARTRLTGQLIGAGLPAVTLALDGDANDQQLHVTRLQADAGGARLEASGTLSRRPGQFALQWRSTLRDFDPAIWWPRASLLNPADAIDRLLAAGPHRLNGRLDADVVLPARAERNLAGLGQLRGEARLTLQPSRWAGVPLSGELELDGTPQAASALSQARMRLNLELGPTDRPTRLSLGGDIDPVGTRDHWQFETDSGDLAIFNPWLRAIEPTQAIALAGRGDAQASLDGRWPQLRSGGRLRIPELSGSGIGRLAGLQGQWQIGTSANDPVEIDGGIDEAELAGWRLRRATLKTTGRGEAHQLQARIDEMTRRVVDAAAKATTAGATASSGKNTNTNTNANTSANANANALTALATELDTAGGWQVDLRSARLVWQGRIDRFELRERETPRSVTAASLTGNTGLLPRPLRLTLDPTRITLDQSPERTELTLGETRAHLGDIHLALRQFAWQQDRSGPEPVERLSLRSQLDAIEVAPILQRMQPGFGWGGDLRIGGHIDLQATPERFSLDASVLRESGDLRVTDPDNPKNPQRLGLEDLRFVLSAQEGRWRLMQHISGGNLGRLNGEQSLQTRASDWWPDRQAFIDGRLDLQIAQLGNWGRWLPAGWRLSGRLGGNARLAGRLGQPELSGELVGQRIAVRNLLQGVDWNEAQMQVRFDGSRARIETFSLRAGEGRATATGELTLGDTPRLTLQAKAEKFAALQRVDRRLVVSGDAQLRLDARSTVLTGSLKADEGRIDFSNDDAPSLADDVDVQRPEEAAARAAAQTRDPRINQVDLRMDLGPSFMLKGRGLNTRLAGDLRLSSPGNKFALGGVIRAEDGTYAAYGQKLTVDRGIITFIGAPENPRLDIEATRSDLEDVRVGVLITGTAQAPRVRLFSSPTMTDTDKLSWLLLGRASDGLGRTDLALLQRAAFALLSGEQDSPSLIERIGLDELSVRQSETGDTRETVVTLGKQLSRRWFVGYERSLNAAAGNWQLIYRAAQRFTLRALSGNENALDLIWTWKWGDDVLPPDITDLPRLIPIPGRPTRRATPLESAPAPATGASSSPSP